MVQLASKRLSGGKRCEVRLMYVATASPRPKRSAFDGSRGGGGNVPYVPPLGSATVCVHKVHAE